MKIPVFVSCPTTLSPAQDESRQIILRQLGQLGLEPRALGRSDYPTEMPLREVVRLARHCSGAVILGFEQFQADGGLSKRGTPKEKRVTEPVGFPSAWNQLEAGILYSLALPTLVFREEHITGGIFDDGVTDVFVHPMPKPGLSSPNRSALRAVFMKWQADVRRHYYGE